MAIAALLLFVYTPLVLGDIVFSRDVGRLYFAVHQYLAERLRAGELPLWYPYEALGVPFIASAVTAVFHPLTWLSVVLGPVRGMWAGQLAAIVVGASGSFLLARRLGTGTAGATIAAITFAGGGALASMLDLQTFYLGPVAFPWLMLGVHGAVTRVERERTARFAVMGWPIVLGAAALAWQVLAGDMQGAMVTGLASLAFGLTIAPRGFRLRALGVIALIGGLGAMLSAVQLLPSLSIASELDRGAGLDWHRVREWSFPAARLSEIFLSHQGAFASPEVRSWLYPDRQAAWHFSVYQGVFALFGTALAIPLARERSGRGRAVLALLVITAVLLWLAMGRWAGLYRLTFEVVPLWDGFRYPEKLLSWAALPLALLAGLGAGRALESPRRAAGVGLALSGVLLFVAGIAWALGGDTGPARQYLILFAAGVGRNALLCGGLGLGFFLIWRRALERHSIPGVILVIFVLLDLSGSNGGVVERMTADPVVLRAPSLVGEWLRDERGLHGTGKDRITTVAERGLALALPEDAVAKDEMVLETMLWSRSALEAGHAGTLGFESTTHYLPALSTRQRDLQVELFGGWVRHGAHIFGGRYLIVSTLRLDPASFRGHQVALDRSDLGIRVLEHPGALPRVFVADPRWVDEPALAREALTLPEVVRGEVAVVESSESTNSAFPVPVGGSAGEDGPPGRAELAVYRPERVEVRVEVHRPSVLVLNDAWWPGWSATVDKEPRSVLRANYLVRGVLLQPGETEVVFLYRTPPSLLLGGLSSLLAAAGCLALALAAIRRRKR